MALFQVTVYKRNIDPFTNERWSNVYWVDAIGPNDAITRGENIGAGEALALTTDTVVEKISSKPAGGGAGANKGVNIVGIRASDVGNMLPLFNCCRVTFLDAVERPEQKYYRGCVLEGDMEAGLLTADFLIDIMGPSVTAILDTLGIVGNNGEEILGHTINRPVQMRQLSWHRRPRVGFHRGWVAD